MGETPIKVIIAGGREFKDYEYLCLECDSVVLKYSSWFTPLKVEVISGAARGADRLGERYAKERGFKIIRFFADWDTYGKAAGYKRNEEMAKCAHALIAFWDGKSKGTKHMIDLAEKHGLNTWICEYS